MDTITLPDPTATHAYARALAAELRRGEALALCGELGAGKTHFTKGLAEGLGHDPTEVTSPTFTLVHEYTGGTLPLYHFDFYRLETEDDVLRLGWDEYLAEGVVVVEWANRYPRLLPAGTRWLYLQVGEGTTRELLLSDSPLP